MARLVRCLSLLLVCGLMLPVAACSRHSDKLPVYPVTGKILYRGQPAEGAQVTFVSTSDDGPKTPPPGATVRSDGAFRLSTYASYDGAPAGHYAVTVVYRSPEVKIDDENRGPDLLRGRYADAKTTPLKVELKREKNQLKPIELP
jgi:hypothetical protein